MNKAALPSLCSRPARQNESGVVAPHKRVITRLGENRGLARRVASEKPPYCVVHRSFAMSKLLFLAPCLAVFQTQQSGLIH